MPRRSASSPFSKVSEAIDEIRRGRMIIVVDDEARENEGDFIVAAEFCRPEIMNVLIRDGSGFVCVPMTPQRMAELDIPMMVGRNTSRLGTAMAISVDARQETTTGVSAADRSATARLLADPTARPADFTRPGHVVPLRAEEGGVLRRAGHTEASVDLCRLAGLVPVAVLAEVMNEDGSMARTPDLVEIARRLDLKILTIADLIAWRRRTERLVTRAATTILPTRRYGELTVHAYESSVWSEAAIALVKGDVSDGKPTLVRVHSSCVTGDLLESLRCDCGDQFHLALQRIADEGRGALIYLEQEGRGIGMVNKIKAYALQDGGADTVEANRQLGFQPDLRDYGIGAQIMIDLGLRRLRLMTNNPAKLTALAGYGLELVEWVSLLVEANPHNQRYLDTKRTRLGHLLPAPEATSS